MSREYKASAFEREAWAAAAGFCAERDEALRLGELLVEAARPNVESDTRMADAVKAWDGMMADRFMEAIKNA